MINWLIHLYLTFSASLTGIATWYHQHQSISDMLGALLSIASTILGAFNVPLTWVVAFAASINNGFLFSTKSNLIMHTAREILQIGFFVYGFYYWRIKRDKNQNATPITSISTHSIIFLLVNVSIIAALYAEPHTQQMINTYLLPQRNAGAPWKQFIDIFASLMHIIGLSLMSRRILESWIIWIIIDLINIPLYLAEGLSYQAGKCIVYLIIATLGYLNWKKIQYRQQNERFLTAKTSES
ncbi:MAG: nicotinamide riboside transporter PnuC [Candidatus Comchoanobacterales bacterium]